MLMLCANRSYWIRLETRLGTNMTKVEASVITTSTTNATSKFCKLIC